MGERRRLGSKGVGMGPWRTLGSGGARPDVPTPAGTGVAAQGMSLVRDRRPLKAWRWVGVFTPELMVCAGSARVGVARMAWWAVWNGERLRERSYRRAGPVELSSGRVHVPGVLDLALEENAGVETISPHGRSYVWTRKQGGIRAHGTVAGRSVEGRAIVDDTAGYHARDTRWHWSAGVGVTEDETPVAWNFTVGVHDAREASERSVWVDGAAHELAPVRFDNLRSIAFQEGGELRFSAEATRARRDNLLLVRSDYEQPFGSFAGELPGAGPLREGRGVMERHEVRW
jgi:hypothetical protein